MLVRLLIRGLLSVKIGFFFGGHVDRLNVGFRGGWFCLFNGVQSVRLSFQRFSISCFLAFFRAGRVSGFSVGLASQGFYWLGGQWLASVSFGDNLWLFGSFSSQYFPWLGCFR